MTKIDIISGFLGAGKTTFIKKLLEEAIAGEQVVLIENEFGEIGIDGGFLKDAGIEIREMNSGCICCSLVGDFGASLAEVITKYRPERIIIEPSGVGKLSDVVKAVVDVSADMEVELNSAVTIVDAAKCKMYMKNFGEFFNNQIENAGTIVLSRTDITDAAKVQKDVDMLREKNRWQNCPGRSCLKSLRSMTPCWMTFWQRCGKAASITMGNAMSIITMKGKSAMGTTTMGKNAMSTTTMGKSATGTITMKGKSAMGTTTMGKSAMSTITMGKSAMSTITMGNAMSTTMTGRNAMTITTAMDAAAMTMTTIMQMRYSQAGAWRQSSR